MSRESRKKAQAAFHDLPAGTDLGSVEYELTERFASRHVRSTHQSDYPAEGGRRLAPVSILASDGIRLIEASVDIGESVHAGQRLEVFAPPVVGSRVRVRGRVADKFEKGGRQFVVIDTVSEDDQGRLLARGRMVGVARYRPEGQV
jgi:hypothetical protein